MMILIFGFSFYKSGEVLQLSRSIEQERVVLLIQAGINEMLASVKAEVNDRNSKIGGEIAAFCKLNPAGGHKMIYDADVLPSELKAANALVSEQVGGGVEISGHVNIAVIDKIMAPRPAYLGYLELIGIAKAKGIPEIRLKERREIKIVDLAYPFIDKYALFVKSYCRQLNNPKKRLVVKGISADDPKIYSYIYLGNRSYPSCPEFPQGAKSEKTPPVLLDLCFKDDKHLLGSFYHPARVQSINPKIEEASEGRFFFVIPPFDFKKIAGSFSVTTDFHNTPELVNIYKSIVTTAMDGTQVQGTLRTLIVKDYQNSGGDPGNSEVFRSIVYSLMQNWKYQYGYSDYTNVLGEESETFMKERAFTGIGTYFVAMADKNPQRLLGGKMPVLFGEGRDIPVYIEGPVYLRFFKLAFLDQVKIHFTLFDEFPLDVPFPAIPLHYEDPPLTFSGKICTPPIDERTPKLMSAPIESLSINNMFFGGNVNNPKTPTSVKGGIEGHDVFPAFDPSLRSFARIYKTVDDFTKDRIKQINGAKILDLDGVSLILNNLGTTLDLSVVEKYRGKGRIILVKGDCAFGDISPITLNEDALAVYLMYGNIVAKSSSSPVNIFASLAALTDFSDNSSTDVSAESGINCNGKSVNIYGNLLVDNLFDLQSLPEGGALTIVHDPNVYFPNYSMRVSIAETRSLTAVNYASEQ